MKEVKYVVQLLLILLAVSGAMPLYAQYTGQTSLGETGDAHQNAKQEMPAICRHMQELVVTHEHDQAVEFIYETIDENPQQPDCFYYNAKLYFNHRLSGHSKHSKPLFDSLMELYDSWYSVSRNPMQVLNNKARDLRDFYVQRPDSLRKYCAMFKRIYDEDKESMHPYNLKVLASCACDLHGKINVDSLWHFTRKQAAKHPDAVWRASYKSLKRELISCPRVSCAKLHKLLHPVLSSGKEGSEETQKLHAMLHKRGCTGLEKEPDEPALANQEPAQSQTLFDKLFKQGKEHMMRKKFTEAWEKYEEAMQNANSPIEKADGYLGMAFAADSLKNYADAKRYAMTAHKLLPDETEAMQFLSRLYQKGEDICSFHSAKEMAAYYILLSTTSWNLGNVEEADAWKENANLRELYMTGSAHKGDKVLIGCFINEEVVLP